MKPIHCIHVKNGLRVNNDGTAMLCCMSTDTLTDINGNVSRVTHTPIDVLKHGKKATEIRNDLKNGIQHSNCQRCWDEEASGSLSKRLRDNETYNFSDESLRIVELNLGTTCNLKCRTCSPWASSQWNKEFLLLNKWHGPKEEYDAMLRNLNHSYDDDSLFWNEFKDKLSTIEHIDMYGGEPFMVKKQWELLQYSIDQGYSKNQVLHFNTNGTQFDDDKINILKEFKHVDISISIDGIDKQFEYQRHPAKWNEVLLNLTKFKECSVKYNWSLTACVTVTNHNIFNLDYTLQYLYDFGIPPYANFLHEPSFYNIKNLRSDIKDLLTEKFSNIDTTRELKYWLDTVVSYMNSSPTEHYQWIEFQNTVMKLDEIRNERFEEVFPEYYREVVKKNSNWSYKRIKYLHVELTNYCNAKCPICPRYLDHSEVIDPSLNLDQITLDKYQRYFSEELLSNLIQITFCGTHGDPMMAHDVISIVEYSIKCNPNIEITFNTNGGSRNSEFWTELGRILSKIRHTITFSIDGLEDTNHLYRKRVKWNVLMNNAQAFINAGGHADWDFLVFKHNQHQITEAESLSKYLGFKNFYYKRALGFNTPTDGKLKPAPVYDKTGKFEYWLEPPDDSNFINQQGEMIKGSNQLNIEQSIQSRADIKLENLNNKYNEYLTKEVRCRTLNKNFFSEVYVNANGHLLPCCYAGSLMTGYYAVEHELQLRTIYEENKNNLNLNIQKFEDIINSNILNKLFADTWPLTSFDAGKIIFCSMACGKDSPLDRIFVNKN